MHDEQKVGLWSSFKIWDETKWYTDSQEEYKKVLGKIHI